jgi:hypothetical protein
VKGFFLFLFLNNNFSRGVHILLGASSSHISLKSTKLPGLGAPGSDRHVVIVGPTCTDMVAFVVGYWLDRSFLVDLVLVFGYSGGHSFSL